MASVHMEPFRNKRILLVSPEAWGPMKISKHHYASTLAQEGAHVYFLSPGSSSATSFGTSSAEEHCPVIVKDVRKLPGQRFLPRPFRALLDAWSLQRIARRHGGGFDLLWNFDVHRFRSLRSRENARLRMLHVMDLPDPSQAYETASNADLVIAVSPSMLNVLRPHIHGDELHVPHGIVPTRSNEVARNIRRPGVNLGYAGNMAMRYLDHRSLLSIAEMHPLATLHLFGATEGAFGGSDTLPWTILEQYKCAPNVILHGSVHSHELPSLLEQMDLLLVAYDSGTYPNETRNAHKVLEYLNTGKAVLASHLADLTHLGDLVTMAQPGRPISELASLTIDRLDSLNTPERMRARKEYAALMTYSGHLKRIAELLDKIKR